MQYQQILPPDHLKDYIRYYWVLESDAADPVSARSFRTMADGRPGLIFQAPDKGVMYQNDKRLPGILLYGQATTHANIRLAGEFSTVGVFFAPNALHTIFRLNAEELTDTCLNLDELAAPQGIRLLDQLSNTASCYDQVDILSSYLFSLIRKNSQLADMDMQHALSRILQTKGSIALPELRDTLQLSERSFERRFKQYVGISPKLFSRITRFQASLSQLKNNQFDKLSDIAFEHDYADQSHFIRTFKEFAGCSPFHFQKNATKLADNFSEVSL